MKKYDVAVLTKKGFFEPENPDWYAKQAIKEDEFVLKALEKKGLKVIRTYWDNPDFNFSEVNITLFRTIWDYFNRFQEFSAWMNKVKNQTKLINPPEIIFENIDKHYLKKLSDNGINIPPTFFINKGDRRSLKELHKEFNLSESVLKPCVSGAGRHTYKLSQKNLFQYKEIYRKLISEEDMMLQEFQHNIYKKGELAFMMFDGKFSHAVLKKGKKGDFRVQDDFGGSVFEYKPSVEEIEFAEKVVSAVKPLPVYARVDIITDNNNKPAIGEIELIEPELWFRFYPPAADLLADAIIKLL
ncbi:MAG: hypothetical protein L3J56_03430 [Bacteroidales bacterium]|nr:hypothetical protein [Bacteroidales bacterium]